MMPSLGYVLGILCLAKDDLHRGLLAQNFPVLHDLFLLCLSPSRGLIYPKPSILSTFPTLPAGKELIVSIPAIFCSIYGLGYTFPTIFQFLKSLLTTPVRVYCSLHREGKGLVQDHTGLLAGQLGLAPRFSSSPMCKQLIRPYYSLYLLLENLQESGWEDGQSSPSQNSHLHLTKGALSISGAQTSSGSLLVFLQPQRG